MRWQAIGGDLERLRPAGNVAYVCPDEGFKRDPWSETVAAADLVILDTINAMMSADGLDPSGINDFYQWHMSVCRTALDGGAAVLALDHVPKVHKASKDRTGFGSVGKLNVIDGAAFMLESVTPPARGRGGNAGSSGHSKLRVTKDRPGGIRGYAIGGRLAEIRFTPGESVYELPFGSLNVSIDEPENNTGPDGRFRPTNLMAKVSEWMSSQPGAVSKSEIKENVTGNGDFLGKATDQLLLSGHLKYSDARRNGHQLIEHVSRYEEDDDPAI